MLSLACHFVMYEFIAYVEWIQNWEELTDSQLVVVETFDVIDVGVVDDT